MLVLIGILTFISILIQSHCLYSQFMIDDFNYINLTPHWSNYTDVFIKPTGYHYNPLNFSLNTFLYQVTTNPFTLKLINFILFTLNGFGVFIIITQLTEHKRIGFLASLLFLVHPINAEMLAHITYNNGIFLSTNLLFFSLWAFLKTAQNKPVSKHQSWLSYLFYFASLLFSEIYLIFPLLLIIYLLTNQYKNNLLWDSVKKYILITLCYLLIWLYLLNPLNSYSTKINHINLNVVEYGIGIAQLINWYITNLFFPTDIVFMKSIARADIQFSPGLLWLFIAILTVWLWIWKLKQRSLKISFLWFFAGLIILLPASLSHVYSMGIVIEPYWFYFTEFGFFSFCAIALYELKNHIQRLSWVLFVGAISLYWGVSSYQIHLIARTEVSYLEHWLKVSPHNLLPAAGLASLYGYESKYPLPTKFQEHMQLQVERLVRAGHYIPAARLLERMQRDENLECVLYVTYLKSHEQNHAERLKSKLLENPSPSQYGKVVQYLLMLNEHHLAKQWIEEGLKRFPDNRLLIDSYDESKSQ